MNEFEKIAILRNALETIGLLLDDPTSERVHRCQILASSALTQTMIPVSKERTLIPHINDPLSQIKKQCAEFFNTGGKNDY